MLSEDRLAPGTQREFRSSFSTVSRTHDALSPPVDAAVTLAGGFETLEDLA
jgi:hypothetical protein